MNLQVMHHKYHVCCERPATTQIAVTIVSISHIPNVTLTLVDIA